MNQAQKNQIVTILPTLSSIKIEDYIIKAHGNEVNFSQVVFDDLSIKELAIAYQNIVDDLKVIFESDTWNWIMTEWVHPTIGHNSLFNHINHIQMCLNQNQPIQNFAQSIQWIKLYLLTSGVSGVSKNGKNEIISLEQLENKLKEIELVSKKTEAIEKENTDLKNKLLLEKQELQAFYEAKQSELKIISDTLATVLGQKAEMDNIFKSMANADSEIRIKFQNQDDLLNQIKSQKENQDKEFKTLLALIDDEKGKLDKTITDSDSKLKFFESLESFIKEKQKEIIDLGALAAGAALGGTFGLRVNKLDANTNKWIGYVPLVTGFALIWILLVFTKLKSDTGTVWVDTVLNLAKTIPSFLLLGFVFKQYNKERNLQEDYAFKAAMANTIKAYSDLLREEDNNKNQSKQNMLLEAIKQLQCPPKLYSDSSGRIFSFSTKGLSESIKNLNETMKTISPK